MREATVEKQFMDYVYMSGDGDTIQTVVIGHFVIEALLVELIELRIPGDSAWKMSFPQKLTECVSLGVLSASSEPFYRRLNDIRHGRIQVFKHEISFDDAFMLVKDMAAAGYDFSDDRMHTDREYSQKRYGVNDCLMEAINELCLELACMLHDHDGPDRTKWPADQHHALGRT